MRNFLKKNANIIMIVLFLFLLFIFIDDIVGKSIIGNTQWNSYELQARAWLNGRTYLDHDYPYLELAIFNGNYFVSFPPFPSVILLPFALIFPNSIPANFLVFVIFAMEFILIYKIIKRYGNSELISILLAAGFTVGTNLMSLAIDSGVWFFAQLLNNLLCVLAIDAFLKKKKALTYFLLALAVGCRPFTAIYMVMFFIYNIIVDDNKKIRDKIIKNIVPVLPAMVIALIYMFYNYIRFGNVLEFGHNYLPVYDSHGQFGFQYLLNNLKDLFFNKIKIDGKLNLSFDMPFCFIIANPPILLYLYKTIKEFIKTKKVDILRIMIFVAIFLNILCICMHDTLGAWQFGARYTCDILPFIFLAILSFRNKKNGTIKLDKFEIACIIFGIMLNVFGAIILYNNILN